MDEYQELLKDREETYGGKISFITFANYLGVNNSKKSVKLSGILYKINNQLYFEDFESAPSIFGIPTAKKKYEKFETSFSIDSILNIKKISEVAAKECVQGFLDVSKIMPLKGFFMNFFTSSVTQIELKDNISYFFDITDAKFATKIKM